MLPKQKTLREDKKIRLVVDLENSIKAQQSAGYERWAKIHNLKQAAKSMNFLTENKIEYYSELESKIADIMTAHDAAAKAVKEVEQRMSDLSLLIKHTTTYRQLKPIYDEYRKSPDKEKYLRGHESEIILFEAAARALKEMQIKKLPDLAALRKEYRSLNDRKTKLYEDYRQAKKQMQEYGVVKKNVDSILYPSQSSAGAGAIRRKTWVASGMLRLKTPVFLRLPAHENDIDDKVYSNPQKRLSNCPRKDKKRTGARCRKSATAPLFSMGYSSSVKINSLSENSLSVMACSLFTAAAASWRISSSM